MLAAAMRRIDCFFVMESSRNHPETDSALPHDVLLSPYRNSQYQPGCPFFQASKNAAGNGGGSQRNEYGSVGCVSRVASCCCSAGVVCGGDGRIRLSGFGKIPPRRVAPRGTSCQ